MTTEFHSVTRERWPDLERLFGESAGEEMGNPSRCWCMEWRLLRQDWEAGIGEGNRKAMEQFISAGNTPGVLGYIDGEPAAWCSVAPRPTLTTLQSRGEYRNFADASVWVIICFYVPEKHRGAGLVDALIDAAVEFASGNGARVVEAYPVEPALRQQAGFMGPVTAFDRAGFARIKESRPGQHVVRLYVADAGRR